MKIYFGYRDDYYEAEYWEKLKKDLFPIIEVDNYHDGQKWLREKLQDINFKSYYQNVNFSKEYNYIEIDFGSYTKFCLFYDLSKEDWDMFYGIQVGNKPNAHSSLADYVD